ncbi:MAG: hypothetical protein CVV61_08135, partial [Tenericutes bacterium HGW-Tenericutes-6]
NPADFALYCKLATDALNGNLPKKEAVKPVKKEAVKVEPKVEAKVEVKAETVDYSKMLVKDLKALAQEKGIEGASSMLKADLVEALSKLS